MDLNEQLSLGRTLMAFGAVWILAGFSVGTIFWDHSTGLGLALGGILPLFLGIGIFRRSKRKASNTDED